MSAFVLHDGCTVTVYYSLLTAYEKTEMAKLLAAYIVNFEKKKVRR